ncbi:starch synthase [Neorhodopirellula lusitana]|uniref:Glycogen synthase n=1 Tax=Neorhodopirellula lusitana TaxID=445327 RepID=A0ABY1QI83_9BACT|nr:glycogen/starch synthase [Neorhodopirellula lusitana]SMP72201.1 starch synthase [Neorhodopirellula lusitana]
MNIVYLTTEAVPFAKTGGLADVCGTLPSVVAAAGHRCGIIMPAFQSIHNAGLEIEQTDVTFAIQMRRDKRVTGRLLRSHLPCGTVPVYFVEQPDYFDRPGLYGDVDGDYHDNAERFIFFSRAAIEIMKRFNATVDVVQCNDWQSALVPALLRAGAAEVEAAPGTESLMDESQSSIIEFAPDAAGRAMGPQASESSDHGKTSGTSEPTISSKTPTILSIHNLAYQGGFPSDQFPLTGLSWSRFRSESFEFYGGLNFLKTGVVTADQVCTVSPNYAREIKTPVHGCGLDPILRGLGDRVSGIINGIDTSIWNPETDPNLVQNFTIENWQDGKVANKLALQAEMGLPQDAEVPMLGLVGRLADQKGWDLIVPVIRQHLTQQRPTQWVVLGSGNPEIERELKWLAGQYDHQLAVHIGFSDALAHRIEASSDLFLMPSRYEPCGLNQLYSLRYGTVCVVTATGGLADTIVNTTPATLQSGTATGFHMKAHDVASLDESIGDALRMRYHAPENWKKIVETGMTRDWSWRKSAAQYIDLYARTISLKTYS